MNNNTIPGISPKQWETLYPTGWENSNESHELLDCAATWDSSSDLINYDDLGLGALNLMRLYLTWDDPLCDLIEEEGLCGFIQGALEPDMKAVSAFQQRVMKAIPMKEVYDELAQSFLSNCGVSAGYRQEAIDMALLFPQVFTSEDATSPSVFLSEYYQTLHDNAKEHDKNYLREIEFLKDANPLSKQDNDTKSFLDDDAKVYYILNSGSDLEKRLLVEILLKHANPTDA